MEQGTGKLLIMHEVLLTRVDKEKLYVSRKEGVKLDACIEIGILYINSRNSFTTVIHIYQTDRNRTENK